MTMRSTPYSVGRFFDDVEREFAFLRTDYGMTEASSKHISFVDPGISPLGLETPVAVASPSIVYDSQLARVIITHDQRAAVDVRVEQLVPPFRSLTVQELVKEAGATDDQRYGEIYDSSTETAEAAIKRMAEGLTIYGREFLLPDEGAI